MVPRHVPDPDVAVRRPEPTACFIPFVTVTLMSPSSATCPDAATAPLADATLPLLIPIWTVAPLVQALFLEAIRTFHSPSNVAAPAGVAASIPSSHRMRMDKILLRECLTAVPFVPTRSTSQIVSCETVIEITSARQALGLSNQGA